MGERWGSREKDGREENFMTFFCPYLWILRFAARLSVRARINKQAACTYRRGASPPASDMPAYCFSILAAFFFFSCFNWMQKSLLARYRGLWLQPGTPDRKQLLSCGAVQFTAAMQDWMKEFSLQFRHIHSLGCVTAPPTCQVFCYFTLRTPRKFPPQWMTVWEISVEGWSP